MSRMQGARRGLVVSGGQERGKNVISNRGTTVMWREVGPH